MVIKNEVLKLRIDRAQWGRIEFRNMAHVYD